MYAFRRCTVYRHSRVDVSNMGWNRRKQNRLFRAVQWRVPVRTGCNRYWLGGLWTIQVSWLYSV